MSDAYISCCSEYLLSLSQATNFGLFQPDSMQMRILNLIKKWLTVLQMGRKHSGKSRNCSLRVISPFPSVFKRLLLHTHENQGLFEKGLKDQW